MHFYEKVYPGRLEDWKIEKLEDWKIVLETTKEKVVLDWRIGLQGLI